MASYRNITTTTTRVIWVSKNSKFLSDNDIQLRTYKVQLRDLKQTLYCYLLVKKQHSSTFFKIQRWFGFVCRQKLMPQKLNSGTNPTGLATTLMFCVQQVRTLLLPRKKMIWQTNKHKFCRGKHMPWAQNFLFFDTH